ncbi:MAG: thiamine diphosphokinase [Eubacteriales bacterium]|nr:thiamine diphosphokinase [Eubacteriales bacterium]
MKTAVIVTGGKIEKEFVSSFLNKTPYDYLIGVDHGIEFLRQEERIPTHIVGDFDSSCEETLEWFRKKEGIEIRRFLPEKDETDTQIAVELTMELQCDTIYILGGSGTRIDHLLGNLQILSKPFQRGIACYLLDSHNKIQLCRKYLKIKKTEQFGKYVSLIPHGEKAEGVTLKGFYYPLSDAVLDNTTALGISNEIVEEEAEIFVKTGDLFVIESRD